MTRRSGSPPRRSVRPISPRDRRRRPGTGRVAAATAVAWAGFVVHNAADLPGLAWTSVEYVVPTLVWIGLFVAWWRLDGSRRASLLLFGWGIVNLAGAVTTVLPLAIWPFEPEQSVRHYLFHVLYTVAQVPLVVVLWPESRRPSSSAATSSSG